MKAEAGFEPANDGFAIRSLGPLGYSAGDPRVGPGIIGPIPARVNAEDRGDGDTGLPESHRDPDGPVAYAPTLWD